jgi:hypothetical protein
MTKEEITAGLLKALENENKAEARRYLRLLKKLGEEKWELEAYEVLLESE